MKKCLTCDNTFKAVGRKVYCGSSVLKTGCSYLRKREKGNHSQKIFNKNNPEYFRYKVIKSNYGLEKDEYLALVEKQNNLCAICFQPETDKVKKFLSVDHDHTTGKVRGLLCSRCNKSIGAFEDNVVFLSNAIKYLKQYEI